MLLSLTVILLPSKMLINRRRDISTVRHKNKRLLTKMKLCIKGDYSTYLFGANIISYHYKNIYVSLTTGIAANDVTYHWSNIDRDFLILRDFLKYSLYSCHIRLIRLILLPHISIIKLDLPVKNWKKS